MKPVKVTCINDPNLLITEMWWERINLGFVIDSSYDEELTINIARLAFLSEELPKDDEEDEAISDAVLEARFLKEIPLVPYKKDGNKYYYLLNMSAMDGASFLDNGRWRFAAHLQGSDCIHICTISHQAAYKLQDMCRVFSYAKGKYSYNIYFATFCNDSTNIVPVMNSRFMIENPNWRDRYAIAERLPIEGK